MAHDRDDLLARLDALRAAIPDARVIGPGAGGDTEHESDIHAAATAVLDQIIVRIQALTTLLQARTAPLDAADRLTACLLLADLALVAGGWQALGKLAAMRLEAALVELQDAGRQAERVLKDAMN